jgi:drug/metabolite transporter (DMT)-like permease
MLLAASIVWGVSYPMNRQALFSVEPLTFAAFRYLFGTLALAPCALRWGRGRPPSGYHASPHLWIYGGMAAGSLLTLGTWLQYYGLTMTTAGKSGFITSLYVSMVPLFGFVLGQIPGRLVWAGLAISVTGLLLISSPGGETGFNRGDALTLTADLFWAAHVFLLGHFAVRSNPWRFVTVQAAWCCLLSFALASVFGTMCTWPQFVAALPFMLWGVMAVGVAYVWQAMAQVSIPPTAAALMLQFQPVVAAIAGAMFMSEPMSLTMAAGATLLVGGALVGQRAGEAVLMTQEHPRFKLVRLCRVGTAVGLLSLCGLTVALT